MQLELTWLRQNDDRAGVMVEGCDDDGAVRLRDNIKCLLGRPCHLVVIKGRNKILHHAVRAREGPERRGRGWALQDFSVISQGRNLMLAM